MKTPRLTPEPLRLSAEAARVVRKGHPWLFASHVHSKLPAGQWLKLLDEKDQVVGWGIRETEGAIGVRVFSRDKRPPTIQWLRSLLRKALERRKDLRRETNAFRALHGENDGLPGVVLDVYGKMGVLQTYSRSVDVLGRWAARVLRHELGLQSLLWKLPVGRRGEESRWLAGKSPGVVQVREGGLRWHVDVEVGQKSGAFLDLRGLRRFLGALDLAGKRVLNLFSYTGTLGFAAESAGADEVWNVDVGEGALRFGEEHHSRGRAKWIRADVFDWLEKLGSRERFDLVIVDPPAMTTDKSQVDRALKTYRRLYAATASHVSRGGRVVACCCTSRIGREVFRRTVDGALGLPFAFEFSIPPEADHPVGFEEGDYLKILVYKGRFG